MPALVAGIHVFLRIGQGVDGRDKPGHDDGMIRNERNML
jgi:2-oxoglutarate ferredoxin oxidoreductase subunit beta